MAYSILNRVIETISTQDRLRANIVQLFDSIGVDKTRTVCTKEQMDSLIASNVCKVHLHENSVDDNHRITLIEQLCSSPSSTGKTTHALGISNMIPSTPLPDQCVILPVGIGYVKNVDHQENRAYIIESNLMYEVNFADMQSTKINGNTVWTLKLQGSER